MEATEMTGKGKEREIKPVDEELSDTGSDASSSSSSSDDSSDSESESEPEITKEYLDSLIQKARATALQRQQQAPAEDVLSLEAEPQALPSLDAGLPKPYIDIDRPISASSRRDTTFEAAEKSTSSLAVPQPPPPPPELNKFGKPLTKREAKALKKLTAGPDWFNLPAPAEADLPRLHREVEALRLRNQLDPKRFYRKDEGEGRGMKGLPKYFAIGTVVTTKTPFDTASTDNLTRAERKRTLVDELVDDAEARRYAKKKFNSLQSARGSRGRGTLQARQAARRGKW